MAVDRSTRGVATGSRAGDRREAKARVTVPMIGVKWSPSRHGDLRRRLREAVAADGAEGYADWLTGVLDARDAKAARSLREGAHPLAVAR